VFRVSWIERNSFDCDPIEIGNVVVHHLETMIGSATLNVNANVTARRSRAGVRCHRSSDRRELFSTRWKTTALEL
jgi:hypothetical protein